MKHYSMTWKNHFGAWEFACFDATCDTDARFYARQQYRKVLSDYGCGLSLIDFKGNYIEL